MHVFASEKFLVLWMRLKKTFKQGTTHGIYEIILPAQFFNSEKNSIEPSYKVFSHQIKNVRLHHYLCSIDNIGPNVNYSVEKISRASKEDTQSIVGTPIKLESQKI